MAKALRIYAGVLMVVVCTSPSTAHAFPITFEYFQTGTTVPGFAVSASLTVDDDLTDLPTIDCMFTVNCQPDFDNLLAFSIVTPVGPFSLGDFVVPGPPIGFPRWSISPLGINFIDVTASNQFIIDLSLGTIGFNTDEQVIPSECHTTGRCVASGQWIATPTAIPEPSSLALLTIGLLGVGRAAWCKRQPRRPVDRARTVTARPRAR